MTLLRCSGYFLAIVFPALSAAGELLPVLSVPAPPVGVQAGAALGSSVALDGVLAVAGVPLDDTRGYDCGTVKVFHATTGALLHLLPNPEANPEDHFGEVVAVSGTRMVVGTPRDDTGRPSAGSVYVYDLSGPTPAVPVLTLRNPGTEVTAWFGSAVGISGTRVAVGSLMAGSGGSGTVYVYDLAGATPSVPVATLTNPEASADDYFGLSVAISGTRVVAGAMGNDAGAENAGSAYVFDLAGATPGTPVWILRNPEPGPPEQFGNAVAISGARVVVGARFESTGGNRAGSAYVYDLTGADPAVPVTTLHHPEPLQQNSFGHAVAISDARVVVGTHTTAPYAPRRAWVYDLTGATPDVPMATLSHPQAESGQDFGAAVAIAGTRVVVGDPRDSTGAGTSGSAHVFDMAGASPAEPVTALRDKGPSVGDTFGSAVAASGSRVVVGVPHDHTGAGDAGAVHIFDLAGATPALPALTLHNPTPTLAEYFGAAVAISGSRVVVGTPNDRTAPGATGGAYVYDLAGATPTIPVFTLGNPEPQGGDRFGDDVAISGSVVVIGAYQDYLGTDAAGSAYVYNLAGPAPTVPVLILHNPQLARFGFFGSAVAVSGSRVAIGAPGNDTTKEDAGTVYIYDLTSATPGEAVMTLQYTGPNLYGIGFGRALAIDGSRLVVGARTDTTGAPDSGSAWVFDLAGPEPTVPVAAFHNPTPEGFESFGTAVSIAGNLIVAGTNGDSYGASDGGIAYVYDLSAVSPAIPIATLHNPTPEPADQFGSTLAISGTTVVVGAPRDDSGMLDKGSVYIYRPFPSPLEIWRQEHFGTMANAGAAADSADFDADGLKNLVEYAFGLNPAGSDAHLLPQAQLDGGHLMIQFTPPAGAVAIAYGAQSSTNLTTWQPVADTGDSAAHVFSVPADSPRELFLRLTVTVVP